MLPLKKSDTFARTISNVASSVILPANGQRKFAIIYNQTVNIIWLGFGRDAVVNTGVAIPPGLAFQIDEENLWRGVVNGIASAGAANLIGAEDQS